MRVWWSFWGPWVAILAFAIIAGVFAGGVKYEREVAPVVACRHMDGIPVLTPDSGVVCVTAAIQVADTVVPEYVVGDTLQ